MYPVEGHAKRERMVICSKEKDFPVPHCENACSENTVARRCVGSGWTVYLQVRQILRESGIDMKYHPLLTGGAGGGGKVVFLCVYIPLLNWWF